MYMENGRLKALFKLLTTENEAYAPALRQEIAAAINERKAAVDLAVKELAAEDLVEYLYITTTFVALKGKVAPPE